MGKVGCGEIMAADCACLLFSMLEGREDAAALENKDLETVSHLRREDGTY